MTTSNAIATMPDKSGLMVPIDSNSAKADPNGKLWPAYIGHRGPKAQNKIEELDAAGVEEHGFYLVDGEILPLVPCDLHVLKAAKVFVREKDGDILGVSFQDSQERFKEGYRPTVFAAVAVVLGNGAKSSFVPATIILRSGLSKAFLTAMKLLDGTTKPPGAATSAAIWATRSEAHAKSAGDDKTPPGFRFRLRIRAYSKESDNGRDFNEGSGTVFPTPAADFLALNAWVNTDWPRIAAVIRQNDDRITELRNWKPEQKKA